MNIIINPNEWVDTIVNNSLTVPLVSGSNSIILSIMVTLGVISCLLIIAFVKSNLSLTKNDDCDDLASVLSLLEEELESKIIIIMDRFWQVSKRQLPEDLREYIVNINDDNQFTLLISKCDGPVNIILDTHGGSINANDHMLKVLLKYRRSHYNIITNIPYQAFSAGTMLALTGDPIRLGPCATLGPFDPQISFEAPHIEEAEYSSRVIIEGGKYFPRDKMDPVVSMVIEEAICLHKDNIVNMKMIMEQLEYDDETRKNVENMMCVGSYPHSKAFDFEDLKKMGLKVTEEMPNTMIQMMELLYQFRLDWIESEEKDESSDDETDDEN